MYNRYLTNRFLTGTEMPKCTGKTYYQCSYAVVDPGEGETGGHDENVGKINPKSTSKNSSIILFTAGLEISENRHLPCITKFIGIHGENLFF